MENTEMTERNLDAAGYEREVADTDEAKQLRSAIYNALNAYADYLDRHDLIWDLTKIDSGDPLKAEGLIAEMDFGSTEFSIMLKIRELCRPCKRGGGAGR